MNKSEEIKFALDIHRIKEIPFEKYEKNFTFIINGKEFQTNRIIADILSPIIQKYHFTDATFDTFYINTQDEHSDFDFSSILSLGTFNPIKIEKNDLRTFMDIFSCFCSEDSLLKFILDEHSEVDYSNVFERILKKQYFLMKYNKTGDASIVVNNLLKDEIDFISSNFSDIDKKEIEKLDKNIIEEVIKNDKLTLKDEDSLLQFIIDIYENDPFQSYLFEYVEYMNVSNEELLHFFEIFDIDDINLKIWKSIAERTIHPRSREEILSNTTKLNRYKKNTIILTFPFSKDNEFNGIIKYLTDKTGGNIHDNGTINVSSNSIYGNKGHPKNLLDFNEISSYHSNDQSNVWICFDFKNMKVQIDHYSIESYYCPSNYGGHMKNWVVEVSNDNVNWTQIDKRTNCSDLNGNRKIGTFVTKQSNFSRYIRILHAGTCWDDYKPNNCTIFFHCIEFYGKLKLN